MTREERIKAFTMRIDGHNWQEIAREIGYADSTIKNDLSACIRIPPRPPSVIYPVVRKYIVDYYGGVVKSFIMDLGGISYTQAYQMLSGRIAATRPFRESVAKRMGTTVEAAFRIGACEDK